MGEFHVTVEFEGICNKNLHYTVSNNWCRYFFK